MLGARGFALLALELALALAQLVVDERDELSLEVAQLADVAVLLALTSLEVAA